MLELLLTQQEELALQEALGAVAEEARSEELAEGEDLEPEEEEVRKPAAQAAQAAVLPVVEGLQAPEFFPEAEEGQDLAAPCSFNKAEL